MEINIDIGRLEQALGIEVLDYTVEQDADGGRITIKVIPAPTLKHIDIDLVLCPQRKEKGLCYCGNPIDYSNPDCEAFSLCKEHAADS